MKKLHSLSQSNKTLMKKRKRTDKGTDFHDPQALLPATLTSIKFSRLFPFYRGIKCMIVKSRVNESTVRILRLRDKKMT